MRSIKQIGLWPYSIYLLGRLLRALRCGTAVHYCIMAVDLRDVLQSIAKKQSPKLVSLKRGDPRLETLDAPATVIAQRLNSGAVCFGLVVESDLRAWIWCCEQHYDEDEVRARFLLPEKAVWDFGAFVAPRYRFGRSFEKLWHGFAQTVVDQGQVFSMSRIATHNTSSLNAHARLPHSILGYCTFIRVFQIQLSLSSLLPKWHVSRCDQDKPVFHLNA